MPEYKIYYISKELFKSETKKDIERYRNYTFSPGIEEIKPLKKDYEFKYEGEFENLEDIFVKCQNDFNQKPFNGRSMMVGDIVEKDNEVYMVDSIGFYKTEWREKTKND